MTEAKDYPGRSPLVWPGPHERDRHTDAELSRGRSKISRNGG